MGHLLITSGHVRPSVTRLDFCDAAGDPDLGAWAAASLAVQAAAPSLVQSIYSISPP